MIRRTTTKKLEPPRVIPGGSIDLIDICAGASNPPAIAAGYENQTVPDRLGRGNSQLLLKHPDSLGTAPGGPSLPLTNGLVLDLRDHLHRHEHRPGLVHDASYVGGKVLQIVE